MITCHNCGAENALGAMFCRNCGEKLDMSASQVASGVNDDLRLMQLSKFERYARTGLTFGAMAIGIGCIMAFIAEPPLPRLHMPLYDGKKPDELILQPASAATWNTATGTNGADAIADMRQQFSGEQSLRAWRASEGVAQLHAIGVDMVQVRLWQEQVILNQTEFGSVPGPDRIASTALALLALEAAPGGEGLAKPREKALAWLLNKKSELRSLPNKRTRTLAMMALLMCEQVSPGELAFYRSLLTDGSAPRLQALALTMLPVADRPQRYSALQQRFRSEPLYLALLDLLEPPRERAAIDDTLTSQAAVTALSAYDRVAWSNLMWFAGEKPATTIPQIVAWSKGAPAIIDSKLSAVAGDITGPALAVLAVTAPGRLPPFSLLIQQAGQQQRRKAAISSAACSGQCSRK